MRRPLLCSLDALALAAGLAACGGGGRSTAASTELLSASVQPHGSGGHPAGRSHGSAAAGAHRDHAETGGGEGSDGGENRSAKRFASKSCRTVSACTVASRAHGTFWQTRNHPAASRDGSVAYAPIAGELIPKAGAMALASPAFALNEPLPRAYSCHGAGASPPLQWKNVPADAADLALVVTDLSSSGEGGDVRLIVADIDPDTGGVAAGQMPAGGVVGANAEGEAGYGPVCPQPGGARLGNPAATYALHIGE